jgi:hypothetical protein
MDFKMQIILRFTFLLILSGCAVNKGTKVDYISLLNSASNCEDQLASHVLEPLNTNTPTYTVVGDNLRCASFKSGQSFYKSFETNEKINRVSIRSFYGTSGETAKLFFPEVSAYSQDETVLVAGLVEEIVDDYTTSDGHSLLITYLFNSPVNKFVVYTDSSQFQENYNYSTRSTSAIFVGSAVIPFDFSHNFQISYNAGGPIEVLAN